MLTSLHPSAYLTLRNIGTDLRLNGNRWKCDCNMRSLRRRMAYDHSRGLQTWSMVCASPSILSGRDLLQLEEEDLKCLSAEKSLALHQDVTVYSGSEILLSCSAEDSLWWTSGGQASESQPNTDLLISDISERNTGLYVCVSGEQHIVSIFNLQISKLKSARNGRSLPRTRRQITSQDSPDRLAEEKNQRATSSDLALAVSLSVIFTFLIAFILGVLARPCIDGLWKRVTKKKTSSTTNSVSSVEQRQYDNEAFSSAEEPEDTRNYRERRVTFSTVDIIEDRNINYYDTVASGERDSIKSDSENEYEPVMAKKDKHSAGDSGSENVLRQSNPEDVQSDDSDSSDGATRRRRDMEFENIPDPTEMEERSLSSCSDSSSTEKVLKDTKMSKGDQSITELPQLAEDSVQQRSDFSTAGNIVLLSHISSESKSEIPGFSSEPFENWSPHTNNRNPKSLNTSQDNEELFEFSDSTQSISPRSSSVISPFDNAKQIGAHTLDKQKRGDVSSSSSYISDDEPTQYTVNSDGETEQSERLQYENIDTVKPTVIINQVRDPSFSGSDSEEEITELKVRHSTGKKSQILNRFNVRSQTSSDESEDQEMDHMQNQRNTQTTRTQLLQSQSSRPDSSTQWPSVDLAYTTRNKRRLDIKAPPQTSASTSSSATEDETTDQTVKWKPGTQPLHGSTMKRHDSDGRWPPVDLQRTFHIKRRLDIKAPSPTSDSYMNSDGEYETTSYIGGQRPGKLDIGRLPFQESKRERYDPDGRWPIVNLQHIPHIKRRLDIKAPSPTSDSLSSTDSEDETNGYIKKQEQKELHVSRVPVQGTQAVSRDPESHWPTVDLRQTMGIKRRLDIKAPSPTSDSSAGSDGEYETTSHIGGQRPGKLDIGRLPFQESKRERYDPDGRWPIVNLQHIPHIKRRLDIKAPSPTADSSASTDSEVETKGYIEKQEQKELHVSRVPVQGTQAVSRDPKSQWPAVDLWQTKGFKRRLDIKAPSPNSDSSASTDGKIDTTNHIAGQQPGKLDIGQTNNINATVNQWPAVNLGNITKIKRRLDIKTSTPSWDSAFSVGNTSYRLEEKTANVYNSTHRYSSSSSDYQEEGLKDYSKHHLTSEPDPNPSPELGLSSNIHIKRRLDIKAQSHSLKSSSSSDESDSGTTDITETMKGIQRGKIPHIKNRLDIKVPSQQPDMQLSKLPLDSHQSESHSSRSESEGENRGHKEKAGMGISTTSEKKFIRSPRAPMISVSHNPKKDPNIKLEKYGTISDESENKLTDDTVYTTEINPELQSRWATMNLGISRFRQRLEITSHTNEQPNVSQPPSTDSLHSLSTESRPGRIRLKRRVAGMQEIIHTDYSPVLENNPVNVFTTIKNPNDKSDTSAEFTQKEAENYSLLTSKNESESETVLVDFGDSQITKYPDFSEKAPSKPSQQPLYSSSRSISEDKTIDQYVLDLSLGVPRIKQRLNFKAPSPEPSSSSSCDSENENSVTGYQAKQNTLTTNVLEVADDSPILYKRSIIKTSSIPSYSFTPSDRSKMVDRTQEGVGDRDASLPSISFDTMVRRGIKQRHEIKQTDVGHHLPDLPISKATSVNALTTLQQAPSAEPRSASRDSSSSVSFEIMQDHEKSATLLHKYSSLTSKSVTPSTSDIYDKLGSSPGRTFETSTVVSEDKRERRGLSALKDKSLEMRKWDSDLDKDAAPLFDDQHPQGGTQVDDSSYTADTEVLSEQQLPNANLDSASANEKRILNLLYGIPQYRRHDFGHPKPPQ